MVAKTSLIQQKNVNERKSKIIFGNHSLTAFLRQPFVHNAAKKYYSLEKEIQNFDFKTTKFKKKHRIKLVELDKKQNDT